MHQGTYPLRRLWRQIDAIHGLRSEKRGKRNDVCPGGQTDSKPFKMTRVGIRPVNVKAWVPNGFSGI